MAQLLSNRPPAAGGLPPSQPGRPVDRPLLRGSRGLRPTASVLTSICASGQPETEDHAGGATPRPRSSLARRRRHQGRRWPDGTGGRGGVTYVEVDGRRTWHEVSGEGQPVVLLHGAFAGASSWSAQARPCLGRVQGVRPGASGPCHTPDVEGPLSYDAMADDTVAYLDGVVGGPAHLVRWWWAAPHHGDGR
jgi:hypothetical protein